MQVCYWEDIGDDKKAHMWAAVIEQSARNSENRSLLKQEMLDRTRSKPFGQIIYNDLGGKDGKEPDVGMIFFETRKKRTTLATEEAIEKYVLSPLSIDFPYLYGFCFFSLMYLHLQDHIRKTMEEKPHLSYIEIVDECFKPSRHNYVIGCGGGMRPKDVRGPYTKKVQLQEELRSKDQEISSLMEEMKDMKAKLNMLMSAMLPHRAPSYSTDGHDIQRMDMTNIMTMMGG